MLCLKCRGISFIELVSLEFTEDEKVEKCQLMNIGTAYRHQLSFKTLLLSAAAGCPLCDLIATTLAEKQRFNNNDMIYRSSRAESESALIDQLSTDFSASIYLYKVESTERQETAGIFEIAIVATFEYNIAIASASDTQPDAFFWRALEVWLDDGERLDDVAGYAHRSEITSDPLSTNAVRLWQKWLLECRSSHANCSSIKRHCLPTRVLDVGPSDGSIAPRLHQSMGETGEWATLSHCWGKSIPKMLTSTTVDDLTKSISMTTLSNNFQDAIRVTRILGIQYLWIDSLCIIQDSMEDWLRESARMGEIYKNSILTIAATNAADSTTGFLRKRPAEVHCQLQGDRGKMVPVYIRSRIDWYCFPEIVGPLTRRAWVLQERLLSRRILHFGGQQTMWQCRSKTLAEGFSDADQVPQGQIPEETESMLRNEFHSIVQQKGPTQEKSQSLIGHNASAARNGLHRTRDIIYDLWYHVIGIYGCLSLTKITDKLPAIAGIARQVQLRTGDVYLSGLWKSDIERGLQWYYQPASVLTKPSSSRSRAPSWSWASPDVKPGASLQLFSGTTNLSLPEISQYRLYEHSVRLLAFSSHFALDNCLGNAAGSITLLGLWIDAKFGNDNHTSQDPDAQKFHLSYPNPLFLQGHSTVRAAARLDGDEREINTVMIGCLQVGKFEYTGRNYPREEYISTLLLERIRDGNGDQTHQYIRIGLGVLFKSCDPLQGWERREVEVV